MAYDAMDERERLAKLFYELVMGDSLDRATALKQFAQGVSRQADETRLPLERILDDLEADAIDISFGVEEADPSDRLDLINRVYARMDGDARSN